ncbi:hypothetical protein ABPG72_010179 [Tetrahymena utriculariae]
MGFIQKLQKKVNSPSLLKIQNLISQQKEMTEHNQIFNLLKNDINIMKEDINQLKGDIVELKEDMIELKEDISELKLQMQALRNEFGQAKLQSRT